MFFNSFSFAVFFSCLLLLCLIVQTIRIVPDKMKITVRNTILLVASYCFYAFLKWEFVFLLLATTTVNYVCSLWMKRNANLWMWFAVVVSIGILGYFKYAGFFAEAVTDAFALLGIGIKIKFLKIALPVGISFFTFQALTYTLDVYKGKLKASGNFIDVALFVSFFPTILSGPIEKARNLLPQIRQYTKITGDDLLAGGKLFIWGLFKKMVIADRLAYYVDFSYSFGNGSSITLIVTAVFYSFQIYADFSGYSDMAIGIARALGFRLTNNFYYPYFSTSIKEFWKRWHISLTSWFTEYVYIPLGGNRVSRLRWILNISAVFLLSGLWHGADWTFIVWGALHACYYLVEFYCKKGFHYKQNCRRRQSRHCKENRHCVLEPQSSRISQGIPRQARDGVYRIMVFALVTIAWVFFRIENTGKAAEVIQGFFKGTCDFFWGMSSFTTLLAFWLLGLFIVLDWIRYKNIKFPPVVTAGGYALILSLILLFGVSDAGFVYFQF